MGNFVSFFAAFFFWQTAIKFNFKKSMLQESQDNSMGKEYSFQQTVVEQLNLTIQNKETGSLPHITHKY